MDPSAVRAVHEEEQDNQRVLQEKVRADGLTALPIERGSLFSRFLYPGIVALLVASATFPLGSGQFMAGSLNSHDQVSNLFSNFTWSSDNLTVAEQNIVKHWKTPYTGIFANLAVYIGYQFFFSIISSTIPVPSGIFIPVFNIGAAFGRIVGELMHLWYPTGLRYGGQTAQVVPGGYSTVGAAAFAGAVTHTISTSVIVFELTGQITYVIPILIAVLISNAVASLLAPSIYDSIILIKKLPYLPDLLPSSSGMYNIYVEDFMVRDVKYIYHGMTYEKLKLVLKENRQLRSFPLVDSPESMILLGSIQRIQLIQAIEKQIGRERRLQVAAIRMKAAQERAKEEAIRREMERQRRPSRFQVVPAPDVLFVRQMSEQHLVKPTHCPTFGTQPKKSILKKTNSFTLKGFTSPFVSTSPGSTPYTTVTGAESRIRSAFETIFRKSAQLQDVDADSAQVLEGGDGKAQIVPTSPTGSKKVQLVSTSPSMRHLRRQCRFAALRAGLRHVARRPAQVGGGRDAAAGGLLAVPHRPGALPARGTHLPAQGALPVFDGGGEPGVRDRDRQAGRRRRIEGAEEGDRGRQQRQPAASRPRDPGDQDTSKGGGGEGVAQRFGGGMLRQACVPSLAGGFCGTHQDQVITKL